jgi:glycerate-2-kinase
MAEALKALSSQGTFGAILAAVFALLSIVIGVLGLVLKRLVEAAIEQQKAATANQLKQQEKFSVFMDALTASLNGLVANFQATRTDTLQVVRDYQVAVLDKVDTIVWDAHRETVELLSKDLTGVANRIEASNKKTIQELDNYYLRREVEVSRAHNVTPAPSGVVR